MMQRQRFGEIAEVSGLGRKVVLEIVSAYERSLRLLITNFCRELNVLRPRPGDRDALELTQWQFVRVIFSHVFPAKFSCVTVQPGAASSSGRAGDF